MKCPGLHCSHGSHGGGGAVLAVVVALILIVSAVGKAVSKAASQAWHVLEVVLEVTLITLAVAVALGIAAALTWAGVRVHRRHAARRVRAVPAAEVVPAGRLAIEPPRPAIGTVEDLVPGREEVT